MSRSGRFGILLILVLGACNVAHAELADAPAMDCSALANADFSSIQDAPTHILSADTVAAAGQDPAFCKITGYIWPQVGFELRMPLQNWNGKFLEVGCAGWCGKLTFPAWCAVDRGYACIRSDMGHGGSDSLWAQNNLQAQVDFGYRATHVTALAGKAITQHFYGAPPSKSMMFGCSTGGYQGITEAQRFPWDFDGIVALAPDMESEADLGIRQIWFYRHFRGPGGQPILNESEIELLHQAALDKCDMSDGVKDGIIGNPQDCNFDPGVLACKADRTSGCLSARQIDAVRKIYAGPTNSTGQRVSTRGPFPGSERSWIHHTVDSDWSWLQNGVFLPAPGNTWKMTDFDFDRDYKRLGMAALSSDNNPDLRKFKTAGGKLLVMQGGNDIAEMGGIYDYYDTVERTMGGRGATQEFFRLFTAPGVEHCTGGDGAYAIDYLTYLENWVEHGKAPEKLIGAHPQDAYMEKLGVRLASKPPVDAVTPWSDAEVRRFVARRAAFELEFPLDPSIPISFTRPLYPYPTFARYTGSGDSAKAENFKAANP